MKKVVSIILVLFTFMPVFAQEEKRVEQQLEVALTFLHNEGGHDDIRLDIDSVTLVKAFRGLRLLNTDKTTVIKSIEFYSSVSPEGSVTRNRQLGRERLATAEKVIRQVLDIADNVTVIRTERFIPWHETLLPAIQADSTVPYREQLLKLVYRPEGTKGPDRRRRLLKFSYNGKLWDIVEERYFEHMRKGGAIIVVERTVYGDIVVDERIFTGGVDLVDESDFSFEEKKTPTREVEEASLEEPKHAISIKTNAVFAAALITNIGTEIKLAPRWSLDIMGAYSPYNMIVSNRKIRLFGARPEARYWWGEPMKRGHFIGLHGMVSAFNVQLSNGTRYQDPNHALWGAGLSYGYAMPLGKAERWGVEFTIGVGYARIKYDKYDGAKNGAFVERRTINYFGPTRLGVNFSYRFDLGNKSKNKE